MEAFGIDQRLLRKDMVKQVSFKHKDGARKDIPGVPIVDCSPRMIPKQVLAANLGTYVTVLDRDPTHVVKILLAEVGPEIVALKDFEKDLPETVQNRIMERRADEYESTTRINNEFMARIYKLEKNQEICDVKIEEVDENAIVDATVTSLDLAEIAWADYQDRNIPIPENVRKANSDKIAMWEDARKPSAPVSAPAAKPTSKNEK